MKKMWIGLVLISLIFVLLPTSAKAETEGDFEYSVENGEATITEYNNNTDPALVIPSTLGGYPVTSIDEGAFFNKENITSVTLPSTLKSIGDQAFQASTNIKEVYITDLPGWCRISFGNYSSTPLFHGGNIYLNGALITDISIPSSITEIKSFAFYNWNNLKSVTIPNSVTSIGTNAFDNCDSLTSVTIPDSVTSIGEEAFYDCDSLARVTIPDSVTTIGKNAFRDCDSLVSVTIPDIVTTIGEGTFYNCDSLASVTIPDGVTSIGKEAFCECNSLVSVTIPETVISIGDEAFMYCNSWLKITFEGTEEQWNSLGPDNFIEDSVTVIFKPKATITFVDDDGKTVLYSANVPYDETPEFKGNPDPPVKKPDDQYTYTFAGWSVSNGPLLETLPAVSGEATYIATYTRTVREYMITFLDDDGKTVLYSANVPYDETPVFQGNPDPPVKDPDDQYTYTFAGWSVNNGPLLESLPAVRGEATYIATYTGTVREYKITFLDDDGKTVLYSANVPYDGTPEFKGNPDPPVKEPDDQYTYTFAGWEASDGTIYKGNETLPVVSGEVTYTATYEKTVKQYNVTFLDYDGKTVLKEATAYDYGTEVSEIVLPDNPERTADDKYTYEFSGWTPEIKDVTGDAVYTAVYSSDKQSYTITWLQDDGTLIDKTTVEYGEMPAHAEPTKEATAQYTYSFAGWDKEIAKVTGDATYKATYTSTVNEYTITFVSEDGKTELQSSKVVYGERPAYKGEKPIKVDTGRHYYDFIGWKASGDKVYGEKESLPYVTGDAIYRATFREWGRTLCVRFYANNGSQTYQEEKAFYGDTLMDYKTWAKPTKEGHIFVGWTPDGSIDPKTVYGVNDELPPVTGDIIYWAVFEKVPTPINYNATFGAGSIWNQGSSDPLTFTFRRSEDDNECFNRFVKALLDQNDFDYSAAPGSTIITISAETLETLSIGEHTLTVIFDDADPVEVKFTIEAKPTENNTSQRGANTGDSHQPVWWISLLVISLIGIGAMMMLGKKRMN